MRLSHPLTTATCRSRATLRTMPATTSTALPTTPFFSKKQQALDDAQSQRRLSSQKLNKLLAYAGAMLSVAWSRDFGRAGVEARSKPRLRHYKQLLIQTFTEKHQIPSCPSPHRHHSS